MLADDTIHSFLDDRSSDRLWLTAAPTYKLLVNSPPMFWDTRRGRLTLRWRYPRFGLVGDVEPRFRELDAVLGGMVDVLGDVLRLMEDLCSALRSQRLAWPGRACTGRVRPQLADGCDLAWLATVGQTSGQNATGKKGPP